MSRKRSERDAELMNDAVINRLQQIKDFWPRNKVGRSIHRNSSRLLERASKIKEAPSE
jgi:hypothetical protein